MKGQFFFKSSGLEVVRTESQKRIPSFIFFPNDLFSASWKGFSGFQVSAREADSVPRDSGEFWGFFLGEFESMSQGKWQKMPVRSCFSETTPLL